MVVEPKYERASPERTLAFMRAADMSLRQYYAGLMMQSLMAADDPDDSGEDWPDVAVTMADALIFALARRRL